ncbi:unnamed protein product [Bursaphelenchus okinawaensis]|uniref:ATP-dependent RNA helicase n=1 Tax=Bursaphelenchus okinawaensis TaxID=465554 RepID=A0A811KZT2_9BILA|nr:unnamed protein product [Bursaphelenchus okinawaensis]CAG9113630.1 unnamed protein product [Bursaphelenchus okinawaensis]
MTTLNIDDAEDLMDVLLSKEVFKPIEAPLDEEMEQDEEEEEQSDEEMEEEEEEEEQEEIVIEQPKQEEPKRLNGRDRLNQWLENVEERLDMSKWEELNVPEEILCALECEKLTNPTNIQQEVVPIAQNFIDVFGAAETGSGKTLAFLIPILSNLLKQQQEQKVDFKNKKLFAVIIAPTRELVMQINKEFKKFSKFTDFKAAGIIGGMSEEKQRRLLNSKPDVIIATPGRFWSWATTHPYAGDFSKLKNVVIDEIDRMLEKGHFKEMNELIAKIYEQKTEQIQTLVFSATLTFLVLPDVTKAQQTRELKLKEIAKATRMRKKYKVVDLTNEFATPTTLKERKICCQNLLEKDSRLYYLLMTYKARTLIFTNSIDASKRLYTLLLKLKLTPTPLLLHAKMQERKRLQNLDRFSATPKSVLIATDVAARGLDIKNIENVIHYQIPRTAEDYIHRSGRTARALQNGMSLLLLDPQDVQRYKKICKSLHRENEVSSLEMDNVRRVKAIQHRCYLASQIEKFEYQLRKVSSAVNWKKRMAKEADLELSDEGEEDTESDEANKKRLKKAAEKALKAALAHPLPKTSLA